jgi:hypothetical protein
MADSEPEVEVGFNEERRVLGMAGDDDDDDLQDDAAAFSFSDNAAINVEDDCRGSQSPDSKFVSIVCWTRMVST